MPTDQRHPLGVTDAPEPRSARQTINEMLDAGLLDELMDRVDAGELTLTGEGGFLPEMVKAVLERGLAAELTEHLGYERGDPAGRGGPNSRNGTHPEDRWPPRSATVPLATPRDRAGHVRAAAGAQGQPAALGGLDEMIIILYAGGMTVRDIRPTWPARWAPSCPTTPSPRSPTRCWRRSRPGRPGRWRSSTRSSTWTRWW